MLEGSSPDNLRFLKQQEQDILPTNAHSVEIRDHYKHHKYNQPSRRAARRRQHPRHRQDLSLNTSSAFFETRLNASDQLHDKSSPAAMKEEHYTVRRRSMITDVSNSETHSNNHNGSPSHVVTRARPRRLSLPTTIVQPGLCFRELSSNTDRSPAIISHTLSQPTSTAKVATTMSTTTSGRHHGNIHLCNNNIHNQSDIAGHRRASLPNVSLDRNK